MAKKFKRIIFCQGDKKELEEITGEEYEYFKSDTGKEDRSYKSSFVTLHTYNLHSENPEITLKYDMYRHAREVGANAVIHYSIQIIKRETSIGINCEGIVQGTLLKKKRI